MNFCREQTEDQGNIATVLLLLLKKGTFTELYIEELISQALVLSAHLTVIMHNGRMHGSIDIVGNCSALTFQNGNRVNKILAVEQAP